MMRDSGALFSSFKWQTRATIALHQRCSGPLLLLGVIIMISGVWSLPRNCYAEEPSLPANSGSLVVSGPSTTPGDTMAIESPAPTKALTIPMTETTLFVSMGAIYMGDEYSEGVIMLGELEKKIWRRFALFARLGRIEYWPDRALDGYGEGGRGEGFELGWRLYPVLGERKCFYLGAGAGRWRMDQYWNTDQKTSFEDSGRRRSWLEHVQFHVGWKFGIGRDNIYLNPMLQMGTFNEGGSDPFFGSFYTSLGIALGTSW